MPLTDQEKALLIDLLNRLDDSLLVRLAGSVSNGKLHANNRQDAFNCVIMHIDSLFTFFNLKRVSSAVLLSYLHQLNESIPGTATKPEMIRRIYQKWNLPYASSVAQFIAPPVPQTPIMPYPNQCMQNSPMSMMTLAAGGNSNASHDPLSQMIRSKELMKELNTLAFNEYIVGFVQTFYDLFNNSGDRWSHRFNETHFFGECKLKIMIKGASEDIDLEGEGVNQVLSVLSELKKEHQLFFNPNLTERGVRSKQDSHGLVNAAVCGTLHQRSGLVGVFEQCFILSQDPFAMDSYKIQETVLILRSSNAVPSFTQLMIGSSKANTSSSLAIECDISRSIEHNN